VASLAPRHALAHANPYVYALYLLAYKAAQDDHAHLELERDDLLFHALDPLVALSGTDVVLPELEEHAVLLWARAANGGPAHKGYTTARRSGVYDPAGDREPARAVADDPARHAAARVRRRPGLRPLRRGGAASQSLAAVPGPS